MGSDQRSDPRQTFYRWSALAMLSPYLENTAAYETLDLSKPLYNVTFAVTPENVKRSQTIVPTFFFSSDTFRRLHPSFGPTNYAFSTGTGIGGGTPIKTDGVFYVNSETHLSDIIDGTSNTITISESNLGESGNASRDPQTAYKSTFTAPLSDNACRAFNSWNYTDPRGFSWVNGEYRNGLFNTYYPPNSTMPDCLTPFPGGGPPMVCTPFGFKTARSRHPGGVNIMRADGSTAFLGQEIELKVWREISTRMGREVTDAF